MAEAMAEMPVLASSAHLCPGMGRGRRDGLRPRTSQARHVLAGDEALRDDVPVTKTPTCRGHAGASLLV